MQQQAGIGSTTVRSASPSDTGALEIILSLLHSTMTVEEAGIKSTHSYSYAVMYCMAVFATYLHQSWYFHGPPFPA